MCTNNAVIKKPEGAKFTCFLKQLASVPRIDPQETGARGPSGTLFDSSVEIARLTMKVACGPRGFLQATHEPNVKWNGRR